MSHSDETIKAVCRLIRAARSHWQAHHNGATRMIRQKAMALYETLSEAERERVPQVLRVWLRYRSEKYFGNGKAGPGGAKVNRAAVWIDVTRPITAALSVWPGDPPPRIEPVASIERNGYAVHRLVLGTHTGTHLDAPCHFIPGAPGVDSLDPDVLMGPCEVVDSPRPVAAARVLYRLGTALPLDVARAWQGVRLIGIDSLSVDDPGSPDFPVHRLLLGAGVIVLEGLDLSNVTPGRYRMVALPLRLPGLDGSPCRVLLRPEGGFSGRQD